MFTANNVGDGVRSTAKTWGPSSLIYPSSDLTSVNVLTALKCWICGQACFYNPCFNNTMKFLLQNRRDIIFFPKDSCHTWKGTEEWFYFLPTLKPKGKVALQMFSPKSLQLFLPFLLCLCSALAGNTSFSSSCWVQSESGISQWLFD